MYEVKVASVTTVVIRRTFLLLRLLLWVWRHPISDLTSFLICSVCVHDQYRRASLQLVSNKFFAEDLPSLSILLFTASRSIIWSPRTLRSALSSYERERTFSYFLIYYFCTNAYNEDCLSHIERVNCVISSWLLSSSVDILYPCFRNLFLRRCLHHV